MATKIKREALRQRIKELAGLTDDERAALLELVNTKKYGLVWENHPEDVEERLRTSLPVLEEVRERYISGSTPDSPNHILIEGDNLEALTALTYTHEGKIDIIYIDPPYNTGNKDFVYNDKYVDSEDSYRHSKWISFMAKRLRIAKRLLSDQGVIFISIDDNEQANLKLISNEIFGNNNFCGNFIWRKKSGGGQTDMYFVTEHEYVMVYQKSDKFQWQDPTNEMTKDDFRYCDSKGFYNIVKLEKWGSSAHKEDRPSMYFPIINEDGKNYFPIAPDGTPGRWRVGLERMNVLLKNDNVKWKNGIPYEKIYYDKKCNNKKVLKSRSILYQIGETGDGTRMLTDIFCEKDIFDNPKPLSLISSLISHNKASTVLDFFAGSGTTMHAVMQLNKEDGGHRQCILVTNNEKNICEEVTYERNKRVINGYTTPKGVEVEGLHNNSLRYYKTKLLPRQRTNRNMHDLMNAATDLLCIKEDIYEEQTIKGLAIKSISRHVRLFSNGNRYMLVIYNEEAIPRVVPWIATSDFLPKERIKVYTFSYNNYAYDDDFAEVEDRVQLCALPAAIYEAYRRVLPNENRYYDDEPIEGKEDEA